MARFQIFFYQLKGPIQLTRSNVIATKNVLPRGWNISFNIVPFSNVKWMGNILHATVGGDVGRFGDRVPGVWFIGGTTILNICSAINESANACYARFNHLPTNKRSTSVIQQIQSATNHLYYFEIYINGVIVYRVMNELPKVFNNVTYYASDPWYAPANAFLSGFKLVTYKHTPGKNTI